MGKESGINTISILGFVFAFIFFPAGLILSIIGLAKSRKLQKEEGVKAKYYPFSIAGLILSSIFFVVAIAIVIFVIMILGFVSWIDDDTLGNYTCNYKYSTLPAVEAEFKNNKFKWGKYGDNKNFVSGTYSVVSRKINNNDYEYELKLKPKKVITTAKINTKDHYYITIKKIGSNTTISFDNSTTYNCHKVGNN